MIKLFQIVATATVVVLSILLAGAMRRTIRASR